MKPFRHTLALLALLGLLLPIPLGGAAPPWDEINDIRWCVDQTSQAVQGVVNQYATWLASTYDANYRAIKCKLHQRPPIVIDGRDPTRSPTLGQAVGITSGSGTQSDPYVIENWEIAGSDYAKVCLPTGACWLTPTTDEWNLQSGVGIYIVDTSAYIVINKVYVHGFYACKPLVTCPFGQGTGIVVQFSPNVAIQNTVYSDNAVNVRWV
jgi:hypothetical protein